MPAFPSESDLFPSGDLAPATAKAKFLQWLQATVSLLGSTGNAAEARAALGAVGLSDAPSEFAWHCKPIGEAFFLRDDLTGVEVPPTDNSNYRYIKLTASDAYNTGVLTSESVSGSAPLITATAVISLADSPLNGRTVNLLNTERRFIRAGSSGTLENDSLKSHDHSIGVIASVSLASGGGSSIYGSSGSATTVGLTGGTETKPRNQGMTLYMRIK